MPGGNRNSEMVMRMDTQTYSIEPTSLVRMATVTMATMIRVLPGLTVMAEGPMVTLLPGLWFGEEESITMWS